MSFDPRSLERLKKLGRELPQSLPTPAEKPSEAPRASERRHKVETEDNPQALFHELMNVSGDGTVPEHLMDRLRQAETKAEAERRQQPRGTTPSSSPHEGALPPAPAAARNAGPGKNTRPQRPAVAPGSEEESLYVAFGQLLLEDDDAG